VEEDGLEAAVAEALADSEAEAAAAAVLGGVGEVGYCVAKTQMNAITPDIFGDYVA